MIGDPDEASNPIRGEALYCGETILKFEEMARMGIHFYCTHTRDDLHARFSVAKYIYNVPMIGDEIHL